MGKNVMAVPEMLLMSAMPTSTSPEVGEAGPSEGEIRELPSR